MSIKKCKSDFLYDIVEYVIDNVTIAEAVGLANPLIITDLDTTGAELP